MRTTALIHEAYLKLAGARGKEWASRGHFLAVSARAVRSILVDYARSQPREKRGGDAVGVEPLDGDATFERKTKELLALDRLAEETPRAARVVGCCYFAGMTAEETATATGGSVATAERDWSTAHRRLRTLLQPETRQGVG